MATAEEVRMKVEDLRALVALSESIEQLLAIREKVRKESASALDGIATALALATDRFSGPLNHAERWELFRTMILDGLDKEIAERAAALERAEV